MGFGDVFNVDFGNVAQQQPQRGGLFGGLFDGGAAQASPSVGAVVGGATGAAGAGALPGAAYPRPPQPTAPNGLGDALAGGLGGVSGPPNSPGTDYYQENDIVPDRTNPVGAGVAQQQLLGTGAPVQAGAYPLAPTAPLQPYSQPMTGQLGAPVMSQGGFLTPFASNQYQGGQTMGTPPLVQQTPLGVGSDRMPPGATPGTVQAGAGAVNLGGRLPTMQTMSAPQAPSQVSGQSVFSSGQEPFNPFGGSSGGGASGGIFNPGTMLPGAAAVPAGQAAPSLNNQGNQTAYVGREHAIDNMDYIFGRDPNYSAARAGEARAAGAAAGMPLQNLGLGAQNLGMSAGYDVYRQGQQGGQAIIGQALGDAAGLRGLEAQQGPSAAQAQLQSGLNQANANALAMARSGRGWGGSASSLSQAAVQQAQNAQQAVNQAAQLRATEDAAWRARQAQNLGAAANIAGAGLAQGTTLGMQGAKDYLAAGLQGNQLAGQLYGQAAGLTLGGQAMADDIWRTQSAIDLAKEQDALQRMGIKAGVPVAGNDPNWGAAIGGAAGTILGGVLGGPAGSAAGGVGGAALGDYIGSKL